MLSRIGPILIYLISIFLSLYNFKSQNNSIIKTFTVYYNKVVLLILFFPTLKNKFVTKVTFLSSLQFYAITCAGEFVNGILKSNIANYVYWFTCLLRKEDFPREVDCYMFEIHLVDIKFPFLCFIAKIDNFLTTPFKCFLQLKALTNFNMTSNIKSMTKVV